MWFDRRTCLLLTHSATLFTIFEADVTASSLRATRQLVTGLIGRELRREKLPAGTFGELGRQVLLAKTADRSVPRCMNDMAFRCEHAIADAGGLVETFRLQRGEGLILSNTRWLHGRERYAGHRIMLRILGDPLPGTGIMPGFRSPSPAPGAQTPRAA